MASELPAAALGATAPRIDRRFVEPNTGMLTQSGYELLFRLITRTGGVAGISAEELQILIFEAGMAPPQTPAADPPPELESETRIHQLESQVASLINRVRELEFGYQV